MEAAIPKVKSLYPPGNQIKGPGLGMVSGKPLPTSAADQVEFDFFRCHNGCGRLITRPEMIERLEVGRSCSCGGLLVRPCNMSWYHWLFPRVLRYAYAILTKRIPRLPERANG